jgi:hypothetical protein
VVCFPRPQARQPDSQTARLNTAMLIQTIKLDSPDEDELTGEIACPNYFNFQSHEAA